MFFFQTQQYDVSSETLIICSNLLSENNFSIFVCGLWLVTAIRALHDLG